ncbi:MAG: DUF460 domain-containing protein [Desulfurococcaceae archaeon]
MGALVTVMGIDIKPGHSPRSSRTPKYAVVILRDGRVISRLDDVPLHSIIRLVIEYHVDVLAVDNIYEVVGSSKDLARISRIIPSWCKVVEVTSTESGFVSVEELATILNLQVKPTTSLDTALINAYAAYLGYGRVVKLPPERVYIIVSKGRTPSQGGASSDRFKRSIRASVLQLVREIKEALDKNHVDYDLVVKESDGGLERGLFVVYASPDKVRAIISPVRCRNVKISVKPVTTVRTVTKHRRVVILGLDPGISVGVAVLDFDGRPLLVRSYKNPDREQILAEVFSVGKPVIVTVDVAKPPEYVRKIASMLRAQLHTPDEDLSFEEKQKIVNEYLSQHNIDVPDTHARDALAAAIKAYKHIRPLMEEIESKIRGMSGVDRDEVVVQVLRGRTLSDVLEEVFLKVLSRRRIRGVEAAERKVEKPYRDSDETARLRSKVSELENAVKRLEEELKRREELLKSLEVELKLLKKRPLDEECERKLNQVQVELDALKRLLDERSNLVGTLRDKVSLFEKLLVDTAMGKNTIACKAQAISVCKGLPAYVEKELDITKCVEYARSHRTGILVPRRFGVQGLEALRVPVVEVDVVADLGDYVLVNSGVLEEIKNEWKRIEELEARERRERIFKMIKEYQELRKKTQ